LRKKVWKEEEENDETRMKMENHLKKRPKEEDKAANGEKYMLGHERRSKTREWGSAEECGKIKGKRTSKWVTKVQMMIKMGKANG
jgi:hypothetical protein